MPTSTYVHIPTLVKFIQAILPDSVLDIGLGNGKIGFIVRDLLDVMIGERYRREEWKIRLDGIEIFEDYIQEHQRIIYNNIYIGDAFYVIDRLGKYDLIIIGDVLEHFEKERAWLFLDKCADHSNYLIINIPLGKGWTQPPIYGNPHEAHSSFWTYEEFEDFVDYKEFFTFPGIGDYGCFLIRTENYIHHRLRERADRLFLEGKYKDAINYLKNTLDTLPPDIKTEYVLVDLLLKSQKINEALSHLYIMATKFPDKSGDIFNYINLLTTRLAQVEKK